MSRSEGVCLFRGGVCAGCSAGTCGGEEVKVAAYVSFVFMALLVVVMFALFGWSAWTGDARFLLLGVIDLFAAAALLLAGAFFAHQAGLGMKK